MIDSPMTQNMKFELYSSQGQAAGMLHSMKHTLAPGVTIVTNSFNMDHMHNYITTVLHMCFTLHVYKAYSDCIRLLSAQNNAQHTS